MAKFNKLIYEKFGVTFSSYLSLSSLAFGIFRANYLGGNLSSIIDGELYRTIQEGYVGGSVDVYKPRPGVLDEYLLFIIMMSFLYSVL